MRRLIEATLTTFLLVVGWNPAMCQARSVTKPLTVVALGTSLTANGGWVEALEMKLLNCVPQGAKVLNLGGSAKTSMWGREQISRALEAVPDVLLIEFAINDAHVLKGGGQSVARDNIRTMVKSVRDARPSTRVILLSMNPVYGLRGWLRPFYNDYSNDYGTLASELGIEWVDLRPYWLRRDLPLPDAIPDGVHPKLEFAKHIVSNALMERLGYGCDARRP